MSRKLLIILCYVGVLRRCTQNGYKCLYQFFNNPLKSHRIDYILIISFSFSQEEKKGKKEYTNIEKKKLKINNKKFWRINRYMVNFPLFVNNFKWFTHFHQPSQFLHILHNIGILLILHCTGELMVVN